MRISQNFFADSFPIFFLASFALLFLSLLFSLSSTLYPLSIHWKRFGLSPSKKTWRWNIDRLGDLAYSTTNFAPKLDTFILVWLCHNLVDIQNEHRSGWICPCCVRCSSIQSVVSSENDDVTSGSMSPDFNDPKIRLLTGKSSFRAVAIALP